MRSSNIALILISSTVLLSACSGEETCAEDANCAGTGGGHGTTTATNGAGGSGGSGGDDPQTLPTQVVVSKPDGTVVAGVAVAANAADGALLSEGLTDDEGAIVLGIPAGGSVSAFHTFTFFYQGQSYTLLETVSAFVGDAAPTRIALGIETVPSMPEPQADEMALGATASPKAGASSYEMHTGCARETSNDTNMGFWHPNCTNDGLYDVVIAARDVSGRLLDYQTLTDQPFIANEKVVHQMFWPGGTIGAIPYSVSNIPAGAETLHVTSSSTRTTHGAPITLEHASEVVLPAESESGTVTAPIGFGSENCGRIDIDLQASGTLRSAIGAYRCASHVDLQPFALDASNIGRFELVLTESPSSLAWTEVAPGKLGDALQAYVGSSGTSDEPAVKWSMTLQPGTLAVTRPELPAVLGQYAVPAAGGLYRGVTNVDHVDRDGYVDVLENGPTLNLEYHTSWEQ